MSDRRALVRAQCESLGLPRSRAELHLISDQVTQAYFREWIEDREHSENEAREAEQRIWNERAITAAQLAAETSREAAAASQRSATWTMWAAVAGALSALAAALSAAIPILQGYGWLPKP